MPLILAYHPEIAVGSITIRGHLDDYYTNDEILKICKVNSFIELLPKLPIDTPIGSLYVGDKSEDTQDSI
jgi:hypothetical protein